MTFIIRQIVGPLGPYILGAVLALFATMGVALLSMGLALKSAHARLDAAKAEVALLRDANTTNLRTIAELKSANDQWAEACKAREPDAKPALDRIKTYKVNRDATAEQTRQTLYRTDSHAQTWASVALPTAVADRLQQPSH